MRMPILLWLLCIATFASATRGEEQPNLLKNGNFTELNVTKQLANWKVASAGQEIAVDSSDLPASLPASLRVTIKSTANSQGSVSQTIKNPPRNTKLTLSAYMKATGSRLGYVQVKLKRQGKELRRESTPKATSDWQHHKVEFDTEDADELTVECRFSTSDKAVDKSVWFTGLALVQVK